MISVFRGLRPMLLAAAVACTGVESTSPIRTSSAFLLPPDTTKVALIDLGSGTYRGFNGGLYPNGSDVIPATHAAEGLSRAATIRPLDPSGIPRSSGKIVMLSVGMSNASQEFCAVDGTTNCFPESFMGRAATDPSVNKQTLVIVNGAQGGEVVSAWTSPSDVTFNVVRDQRLARLGVTEKQVQIVWLYDANAGPTTGLPAANADAYSLESRLASVVRALRVRYPNVREVFVGSREYGGYSTGKLNPEPYAYESGFAVKWLIEAQIDQIHNGRIVDPVAGDLNYDTVAPWIAWGPYTWANGTHARSDGLVWLRSDFGTDGTHPSESGRAKASGMLLSFLKSSDFTSCWFIAGRSC